jgi:hypothetical protein
MSESPGDTLGDGHVRRLLITLQLACETQIAARPLAPLETRAVRVRLQRDPELRKPSVRLLMSTMRDISVPGSSGKSTECNVLDDLIDLRGIT